MEWTSLQMDKVRDPNSIQQTFSNTAVEIFQYKFNFDFFYTDGSADMEPHEDYEDENFNFTAPENMENNDAPNLTKLSEVAIQELDYYNFGKDVGNYSTA